MKTHISKIIAFSIIVLAAFGILEFFSKQEKTFTPPPLNEPAVSVNDDTVITIHYNERAPYQITQDGEVTGILADRVKEIFKNAGVPYKWQQTPAIRMFDIVKQNKGRDCMFGVYKTPERETYGQFTYHIYQNLPTIAIARADDSRIASSQSLSELLSNKALVLLKKDSYSYGKEIDAAIMQYSKNVQNTTAENQEMLKMIFNKRADYFFMAEEEATASIDTAGYKNSDFEIIRFTDAPTGNKRYIMFSLNIDKSVVDKINHAIVEYWEAQNQPLDLTKE